MYNRQLAVAIFYILDPYSTMFYLACIPPTSYEFLSLDMPMFKTLHF